MRLIIGTFALALVGSAALPASAQVRPSAAALSCPAVKALVRERGAVVLSTGPASYERIVEHGGFCEADTMPVPAYVDAADGRNCFAGYRCKDMTRDVEGTSR